MIVVIDTREQLPWTFAGLSSDPVEVKTGTLRSGDYSVEGFEQRLAIERKSLADLYGTLTSGRERFVRELERLSDLDWAAVIVEATWHDIVKPPFGTRANPKSIVGSILAFQQRYPVAWLTAGSRQFGAALCFRCLERFVNDDADGKRPSRRAPLEVMA